MLFTLFLLTIANVSSGLLVRHSNGSLVQLEKEQVVEEVSADLIVGSYRLENGKELHVTAEEVAGEYR